MSPVRPLACTRWLWPPATMPAPAGTDPAALWANSPQTLARALRDPVPAAHAVADVRLAALDDPATDVNARHSAALYLGRHDLPRIAVTEVTGYIVHVAGKLGTDPATANSSMIEGLIPTEATS